jgi:hypothetical protein
MKKFNVRPFILPLALAAVLGLAAMANAQGSTPKITSQVATASPAADAWSCGCGGGW